MRFAIKPGLMRIWHAPEHFRLMDPLPLLHRRGIIIAAAIVVIGFLLPTPDAPDSPTTRNAPLSVESQSPRQAEQVTPSGTTAPAAPAVEQAQNQAPVPNANNDIEQQWRSYRVESGQTMAQLFRDHNLPPADVYAMAQVEGDNKPLSTLQTGQMVKIRQNANGVVTGLTIESNEGAEILFTRQPDGHFLRAH